LDVQCSMFISLFFDQTGRLAASGIAEPRTFELLNPEL